MPYSCAGHLVPYVAAVKNPHPVTSLYGMDIRTHLKNEKEKEVGIGQPLELFKQVLGEEGDDIVFRC